VSLRGAEGSARYPEEERELTVGAVTGTRNRLDRAEVEHGQERAGRDTVRPKVRATALGPDTKPLMGLVLFRWLHMRLPSIARRGRLLAQLHRRTGMAPVMARLRIREAWSAIQERMATPGTAGGGRPWKGLVRRGYALLGTSSPVAAAAASLRHAARASSTQKHLDQSGRTELSQAVAGACRMPLGVLVLFSLGMNLLVLASPLYMLQVY
jgi:hypothetical protein